MHNYDKAKYLHLTVMILSYSIGHRSLHYNKVKKAKQFLIVCNLNIEKKDKKIERIKKWLFNLFYYLTINIIILLFVTNLFNSGDNSSNGK